jgi:SNF2 family DNA or RNA helicase
MQIELLRPCGIDWTPHAYQKKAVKFLLEHACAALFLDPGLGKTSITLAALTWLKRRKMFSKALIIAPVRVCYNVWPGEVEHWRDFQHLKVEVLHGPDKDEALEREADIYVINPEGLDWLLKVVKTKTQTGKTSVDVDVRAFKRFGFDVLVVDELSKFKHIGTNRFKALKKVLHTFGHRWGLTGSPAANGLLDLFGQAYVLDMGRTFGPYITQFRAKYFTPVKRLDPQTGKPTPFEIWKPVNEEAIYERMAPLALRIGDEELDMPQLIENRIRVELPKDVMQLYDEVENDLIAMVNNRLVVANNAAAASTKCRQIANGGVFYYPEMEENGLVKFKKRDFINLHDAKTEALKDLVEELQGSPLLVAYDFEHDVDRLKKAFPSGIFVGDLTAKQFKDVETEWNLGNIELLFGHPQSIGHGLNLQGAGHHVCWHSLTWNYELYDQFIRRVYRQGNRSKKVFVHHIIAKGTIDEVIMGCIKSKHKGQQALFEALVTLAKNKHRK